MNHWKTFALLVLGPFSVLAQETFTNSIGMQFVRIPSGSVIVGEFQPPYPVAHDTVKSQTHPYTMWMGDGPGYSTEEFDLAKSLATQDSKSGFKVVLARDYFLGKFEVTQAQWKKVMGNNPSVFRNEKNADNLPVENVSWRQAKDFIKRLNKLEKTERYQLPTEFEWEYAARAGAMKDISWNDIDRMANLNKKSPMVVGSKDSNAWGLQDMLGNVWEWVEDVYNEKIFADPTPPPKGSQHVLKGASFVGDVKNATYMTHAGGPGNGWDVGFRVLMVIE